MPSSCCNGIHPSHENETKRLNRVIGQVEGIGRMIEERRYCPDILTQLQAVHAALHAVEANILERHLESCVTQVFTARNKSDQQRKIQELKNLYHYRSKRK